MDFDEYGYDKRKRDGIEKIEQKPVVDEQVHIKYLEESNTAMESVLTKIAGELGTPLGDVFALMGTIHVFKEQKKRWAKEIVDAENYCRAAGYKCPFLCEGSRPGQKGSLNHSESCPVSEANQYIESLEGE